MERDTWKWKNMGEFVTTLSFYYVLVGGVAEHDAKTYGKLSLLICITLCQHLGSKVQNSLLQEAFLPITYIKPRENDLKRADLPCMTLFP